MTKTPTALIILDGFGWSNSKENNPIATANKSTIDYLMKNYPSCILNASGEYVGLPKNYIGNSQVGHFTIAAGKVVPQPLTIINNTINDHSFYKNEILNKCLSSLNNSQNSLHIIGLLSDAGVHSHEDHLYAFINCALEKKISHIYLHIILDGRDVAQKSAIKYLEKLQEYISQFKQIIIGSLHGRFYAMDRDQNFNRTDSSLSVLIHKQETKFKNWKEVLNYYYSQNITDEFIPPTQLDQNSIIKNNDGVILFNIRPERSNQLTNEILNKVHLSFFLTPFNYNHSKTSYMFELPKVTNSLMDILDQKNYSIYTISETEKYAHITYFFKCYRDKKLKNETDVLIDSIKTKDYIKNPEMSANEITDNVIKSLENNPKDFYLINYANADMVGHSGDFNATVKAIECLDKQLKLLYEEFVVKRDGTLYITADHGNAEVKFNQLGTGLQGQALKAHTTNPVPFIFVRKNLKNKNILLNLNQLADIKNFIIENL